MDPLAPHDPVPRGHTRPAPATGHDLSRMHHRRDADALVVHVRPMGPSKLLAPVINWMGKRQERTVRAAMKRYLEAPQPKR